MSYANISEVLLEFNKEGCTSSQKSALALSNTSELEIKQLLKQVDTMIHHKKLRWERQRHDLDAKLHVKQQEFSNQKADLVQKNNEIKQLKTLLENMESTTQEIMKKYEKEISSLHQQLNKLKIDFVKLQKKYKKSSKKSSDDSSAAPSEIDQESRISGLSKLKTTNEFMHKINSTGCLSSTAFSTAFSTAPNNNAIEREEIEINMVKLNKHQFEYESRIERLNSQLNEHKTKEMEIFKENEKLNKSMESYKKLNQDLIKKLEHQNQSKKTTNNIASRDNEQLRIIDNKTNIEFYKQELRKRDEHIRDLEALDNADNIEIQYYKDEVKKYKKQEISFKKQVEKMSSDHEQLAKRLKNIETENKKIKNQSQVDEERAKKDKQTQLKQAEERERHLEEMSNLKNQLTVYSQKLNDKNHQIASLNEKSNCLEKLMEEKNEQLTKTNQELIMTVAHVEALRLENHFLKQSLVEKKSDEKEIGEIQKKYHQVLDLTEKENKRLKSEIIKLTNNVESLKSKTITPQRSNSAHKSNNSDFELKRTKMLRDEFEKQITTLKKQHELSVKRLNNEIEKLYSEKHALLAEFPNNNINKHKSTNVSSIHSGDSVSVGVLSSSNENDLQSKKLRIFNGVDQVNRFDEHSFARNVSVTNEYGKQFRVNSDFEQIDPSPAKSCRLSLASQLRYDEQNQKKNLENMLDTHIESLRKSSTNEKSTNLNNFI